MVVNPRIRQQRAVFCTNTTGDGDHLLHLWLNHRDVARIKGQMTLAPADDVVAVERVFAVLQLHLIATIGRERQVVTLAAERKDPPVNPGANLTIVLQPGVEDHSGVTVGSSAGGDVFALPADAAAGGEVGVDVAVRRAVDVQRAAGVAGVELGIRAAAEGFVIPGIAGDGPRQIGADGANSAFIKLLAR